MDTWFGFLLTCLVIGVLLIFPGFILAKAFKLNNISSICVAPVLSMFVIFVSTTFVSFFNVNNSGYLTFLCVSLFSALVFLLSKRLFNFKEVSFIANSNSKKIYLNNYFILSLYVVVACLLSLFIFIKPINGPASFNLFFDNVFHLNVVRNFLSTSNFSIFDASNYVTSIDGFLAPVGNEEKFYPALYHSITALAASATGVNPAVAVNSMNAAIVSLVFPIGVFMFLNTLFNNKLIVLSGAVTFLAFAAFPWYFLHFGPLFPNLLGISLAMYVASLFVVLFESVSIRKLILVIFLILISVSVLVIAHASTIFMLVVFLTPFVISFIIFFKCETQSKNKKIVIKLFSCILFIMLVITVWVFFFKLPSLHAIVSFYWASFTTINQSLNNLMLFALTPQSLPQISVAILTFVGAIYIVQKKQYRWILFSVALIGIIYMINTSIDGEFKHLLAGFWYTDSFRVASMVALFCIPLSAAGFYAVCKCFFKFSRLINFRFGICLCALILLFFYANFYPIRSVPFGASPLTDMSNLRDRIRDDYSLSKAHFINEDKLLFMKKARELIDPSFSIVNIPYDGSSFAHSINDLNTYYREYELSKNESSDSLLIRNSLFELCENQEVKDAVKKINAKYVLKLNGDSYNNENAFLFSITFFTNQWNGILGINENTPGFKLVLQEEDMCLYEIEQG